MITNQEHIEYQNNLDRLAIEAESYAVACERVMRKALGL